MRGLISFAFFNKDKGYPMTYCGWRKPVTAYEQNELNALKGQSLDIPKHKALVSLKKIAHPLGLKSQQILLLDIFAALSSAQDWEGGQRPIVWPCNDYLMQQTGFSLSTLRRHIRKLFELGIIFMKDSPNGKRFGRRNAKGYIIEAYGFDLSPIAARAAEFDALFTHLQEQRAKTKQINTQITLTRRQAKAIINIALEEYKTQIKGCKNSNNKCRKIQKNTQLEHIKEKNTNESLKASDLFHLNTELNNLISMRPKPASSFKMLTQYLKQLSNLLTKIKEFLKEKTPKTNEINKMETSLNKVSLQPTQSCQINKKIEPKDSKNDTHIHTTNRNKYGNSNASNYDCEKQDNMRLAENHQINQSYNIQNKKENNFISINKNDKNTDNEISLAPETFLNACPHFKEMAEALDDKLPRNWVEIYATASKISTVAGIPLELWRKANQKLGQYQAILSIALIYEKLNDGKIKSPQGYLNAIIKRNDSGNLYLMRSFYGKLAKSTY